MVSMLMNLSFLKNVWRYTRLVRAVMLAFLALWVFDFFLMRFPTLYGVRDVHVAAILFKRYWRDFLWEQLVGLGLCLEVGFVLGCIAHLFVIHWQRNALVWLSSKKALGAAIGIAMSIHSFFFLKSLYHSPASYDEFMSRFFFWTPQVIRPLTHALTPHHINAFFAALLLFLFVWPCLCRFIFRDAMRRTKKIAFWSAMSFSIIGFVGFVLFLLPKWSPAPLLVQIQTPRLGKIGSRPQSVLFLVVESLRADQVTPDTMPNLFELASKGAYFDRTIVSVPRTGPSLVAMLTGRYPTSNGIRTMFPTEKEWDALPTTLPRQLAAVGYKTYLTADGSGDVFTGGNFGFDAVDVVDKFSFQRLGAPDGDARIRMHGFSQNVHLSLYPYWIAGKHVPTWRHLVLDHFLAQDFAGRIAENVRSHEQSLPAQPFFQMVFFTTSHFPYATHWPYYKIATDPHYRGQHVYRKNPMGAWTISDAERQQVFGLYQGALRFVDAQIGDVVQHVRKQSPDTIVVVTADHGEAIFDLPELGLGHGDNLIGDFASRVPLIFSDPRAVSAQSFPSVLVRNIDVTPTLLDLLEQPIPEGMQGVSLVPLLKKEKKAMNLVAYQETGLWFFHSAPGAMQQERLPYPNISQLLELDDKDNPVLKPQWASVVVCAKQRAVQNDRFMLRYQPAIDGAHWFLFDIQTDPTGKKNLIGEFTSKAEDLYKQLLPFLQADHDRHGCPLPSGPQQMPRTN